MKTWYKKFKLVLILLLTVFILYSCDQSGFDIIASEKIKYIPGDKELEQFKKLLSEKIL